MRRAGVVNEPVHRAVAGSRLDAPATVLDAYALIAFLSGEPAAEMVQRLLRAPTVIASLNAGEVVDQLMRGRGKGYAEVREALEVLTLSGLRIAGVPADQALLAGRLRASHHRRERMALSLTDCVAAATALSNGWPLATADPALLDLCRLEGIATVPLPPAAAT